MAGGSNAGTIYLEMEVRGEKVRVELNKISAAGMGAAKAIDERFKKLENTFTSVGNKLKAAFAILGAGALVNQFKQITSEVDRMGDMATKLGLSVSTLSKLQYVARMTGSDFETLSRSFIMLGKNLADVADKSERSNTGVDKVGNALYKLNQIDKSITAEGLKKLTQEEQFTKIITALSSVTSQSEKAQIAFALWGKAGAELLPILNEGPEAIKKYIREAEQLGLVLTDEVADKFDKADKALGRLDFAIKKAKWELALKFVPDAIEVIDSVTKKIVDFNNNPLLNTIEIAVKLALDFPGRIGAQLGKEIHDKYIDPLLTALNIYPKVELRTPEGLKEKIKELADIQNQLKQLQSGTIPIEIIFDQKNAGLTLNQIREKAYKELNTRASILQKELYPDQGKEKPKTPQQTLTPKPQLDKESQSIKSYSDYIRELNKELASISGTDFAKALAEINYKWDDYILKIAEAKNLTALQKGELTNLANAARDAATQMERLKVLDEYIEMQAELNQVGASALRNQMQNLQDIAEKWEDLTAQQKEYLLNLMQISQQGKIISPVAIAEFKKETGTATTETNTGDIGSLIQKIGSASGLKVSVTNFKKIWEDYKKEFGVAGAGAITGAIAANTLLDMYQVGQTQPGAMGYASSALSGAGSGASLAKAFPSLGLSAGAGAGIGAVAALGLTGFGAADAKKKEKKEKERALEAEARALENELTKLSSAGFLFSKMDVTSNMIKKNKDAIQDYVNTVKQLSEALNKTVSGALTASLSAPTTASAVEEFQKKLGTGIANIITQQISEIGTKIVTYLSAPFISLVNEFTYYLGKKLEDTTREFSDMMIDKVIQPLKKGFTEILDAIYSIPENMNLGPTLTAAYGTALTAGLSLALVGIVTTLAPVIEALSKAVTKVFEPWLVKMNAFARNIERAFGVSPEWIAELENAGYVLSNALNTRQVEKMKDIWESFKGIVSEALSAGFKSATVSSGWYNFEKTFRKGMADWMVDGLLTGLTTALITINAMAPYFEKIANLFWDAFKGQLDLTELEDVFSGIGEGLNQFLRDNKDLIKDIIGIGQGVKKDIRGYANGTEYVPNTGLYMLHKGEAVIPANRNTGSGVNNINITVNAEIKSDTDVKSTARRLGWYLEQELRSIPGY